VSLYVPEIKPPPDQGDGSHVHIALTRAERLTVLNLTELNS
jgi:hypothetical protein